jgi:spore maturation protein CgeB
LVRALKRQPPDLVLVFKGETLVPAIIEALRPLTPARWVNWFPDSPHLLGLSLENGRAYDRTFIFDSSMVDRHKSLGRASEYLAEGCDPAYHRPLGDPTRPEHPIVFVGSKEPLRAAALQAVSDLGPAIWGPGWPQGALYGDDFVRAFSSARVALNIHQFFGEPPGQGRYGTGANRRVFELAAIGTVQLCDAKADIARNFVEDSEIVLFRNREELRDKAQQLLGGPVAGSAIAQRARERALREHTWSHRLEELLTVALR